MKMHIDNLWPLACFLVPRACRISIQDGESLPSIGSFGHPELCAPPCVYFAWGPCAKAWEQRDRGKHPEGST